VPRLSSIPHGDRHWDRQPDTAVKDRELRHSEYKPGDLVIYTVTKQSPHPGPRARGIQPSEGGEDYAYVVDKFWMVLEVLGKSVPRTRTAHRKVPPTRLRTQPASVPHRPQGPCRQAQPESVGEMFRQLYIPARRADQFVARSRTAGCHFHFRTHPLKNYTKYFTC